MKKENISCSRLNRVGGQAVREGVMKLGEPDFSRKAQVIPVKVELKPEELVVQVLKVMLLLLFAQKKDAAYNF